MFFYDLREAHSAFFFQAHSREVNAISFNPVERYLFATASKDHTIALWDQRNPGKPLHSLMGHLDSVTGLSWNPFSACVLESHSVDRRVYIWDLSKERVFEGRVMIRWERRERRRKTPTLQRNCCSSTEVTRRR